MEKENYYYFDGVENGEVVHYKVVANSKTEAENKLAKTTDKEVKYIGFGGIVEVGMDKGLVEYKMLLNK